MVPRFKKNHSGNDTAQNSRVNRHGLKDRDVEMAETLRESIEKLRAIPAKWKHLADPIGELAKIRRDPNYNPWANPKWQTEFAPCAPTCDHRTLIK